MATTNIKPVAEHLTAITSENYDPAAREIAVLVFPTPPFCEATAIIMVSNDESQNWVFRHTFY